MKTFILIGEPNQAHPLVPLLLGLQHNARRNLPVTRPDPPSAESVPILLTPDWTGNGPSSFYSGKLVPNPINQLHMDFRIGCYLYPDMEPGLTLRPDLRGKPG